MSTRDCRSTEPRRSTVQSAGATTLQATDANAFLGKTFLPAGINFTYDNPDNNGAEYIVQITAGDGIAQTRRIASNTDDTLTLEHPWGKVPSAGDTFAVYQIWATPEAMNPAEGFTANWNNKQARANEILLSQNGRNHRVEVILEQLSLDGSIDRTGNIGGQPFVLTTWNSDEIVDESLNIVKWWLNPETQLEAVKNGGQSGLKSVMADPAYNSLRPWNRAHVEMIDWQKDVWHVPEFFELLTQQQEEFDKAITGQISAKEALDSIAAFQQELLEDAGLIE